MRRFFSCQIFKKIFPWGAGQKKKKKLVLEPSDHCLCTVGHYKIGSRIKMMKLIIKLNRRFTSGVGAIIKASIIDPHWFILREKIIHFSSFIITFQVWMFSSNAAAPSLTSHAKYYKSIVALSVLALLCLNKMLRNIYITDISFRMTKSHQFNRQMKPAMLWIPRLKMATQNHFKEIIYGMTDALCLISMTYPYITKMRHVLHYE